MPTRTPAVVYYITSHGYGHGVRSADILRALLRTRPDLQVHVVTGLDEGFLKSRLPCEQIQFHRRTFDVGMAQLDSIRVDLRETEEQLTRLCQTWDERLSEEIWFLRQLRPALVVADIPGIPLQSAHRLGIPTLAVGNFSWNWIYGEFAPGAAPVWSEAIERFESAYAGCDLLLRLPFAEAMTAFPRQEDLPLLSAPSRADRVRLSELTGADPQKTWVLLSFTNLDWTPEAVERASSLEAYEFIAVHPLGWPNSGIRSVGREHMTFGEVLASVDAVVSKPGYGIVSECVVNEKPLLYADRQNFLEYPILVDAIERFLRQAHLPAPDLYGGDLATGLTTLLASPSPPERLARGGEEVAVARMLNSMDRPAQN